MIAIRVLIGFLILLLSACNEIGSSEDKADINPSYLMKLNSEGEGSVDTPQLESELEESNSKKVIILVRKGITPESVIQEYGGKIEQSYNEMNMAAGSIPLDQIERMTQDSRIVYIEIDKPVELKPTQYIEWGNIKIEAPNALASNFTGKGVKIAVVDTGIATHEDLVIAGGISQVDYTSSYHDDNGHGTHVAGVIGAKDNDRGVTGVAPDSELYAVKVLNQEGEGYASDVIAGIDWSIQNNMDIINLSLGNKTRSPLMEIMINQAVERNIAIVSAAGNDGTIAGIEDNVSYPGRYPNTIAVGAVDQNNRRAEFSSTGSAVEIAAPGVGVLSTYINNSYAKMDGTSTSAPFISGVIALFKQIDPTISFPEIRDKLSRESIDLGDTGRDTWYGFGLVQAPYYFKDIYGHWARGDILTVFKNGWMVGLPDQRFYPSKGLTRAEGAAILVRILGLEEKISTRLQFQDVSTKHWAYEAIRVAYQNGVMVGMTKQDFHPSGNLTREQMVAMLERVFPDEKQLGPIPFTDVSKSRWSYQSVVSMYNMGVISGITPTTFAPKRSVTRAEMAAMLTRISPRLE